MERNQFTFYRSYYEALKHLPKRDQTSVLLALIGYALDEQEPSLSGVALSVFTLIRPTLDNGRKKAENRLNKIKSNEEQTENKPKSKPEQTGKEKESESEVESEVESECEKDILKKTTPDGVVKESAAAVLADFLNRINPSASQGCLDELRAYAEELGEAVCKRAFDIALDSKKANWPYIRAILQDKHARGVRCLADWDALADNRPQRRKDGKPDIRDMGTPGEYEKQALAKLLELEGGHGA